jgi:CheY-like chemotaxis protein
MTGKSILFVEDDRDIRMLLADFLVREGFAVEVAEDGAAVDRVLARTRPDLVILDLMLPGEDGLSICRRLRARGAVPIIMLTAKNDDVDRIVGLELGAADVGRIRSARLFRRAAPTRADPGSTVGLDARSQRRSVRPNDRCDRQSAAQEARGCGSGCGRGRHHGA